MIIIAVLLIVIIIVIVPNVHRRLAHRLIKVILHQPPTVAESVAVAVAIAIEVVSIVYAFATVVHVDVVVIVVKIVVEIVDFVEAEGELLGPDPDSEAAHLPTIRRGGRRRRSHVGVGVGGDVEVAIGPDAVADGEIGEVGCVEAELIAELPELSAAVVLHFFSC